MGAYASIIAGLLKFANFIAAALQQHHNEVMATLVQKGATDAATIKELEAVSAPISGSTTDKLWDTNKARFGTGSGPG